MTNLTTVPLNNLVPSDAINARAMTKDSLDELAASIKAKGLIQPIVVRPTDGGKYEITAGRRRYLALKQLVKSKDIPGTYPVPVNVRNEDDAGALETSLMENTARLPMHPVDQHEVFAKLVAQGVTESEIATRFAISERTVKQHLALGGLAPEVRTAYRKGLIDRETVQAFTMTTSHDLQREALGNGKHVNAYAVRARIAGQRSDASNIPAATLQAYLARGGTTTKTMFDDQPELIDDSILLAAVVAERMAGVMEKIKAEGWAWVLRAEDARGHYGWPRIKRDTALEATPEEETRLGELEDELHDADEPAIEAEARKRYDEFADAIDLRQFPKDLRGTAGAVVRAYEDGTYEVERGLIRPEAGAVAQHDAEEDDASNDFDDDLPSVGAVIGNDEPEESDTKISGALLANLTEIKTEAAVDALSRDSDLALCVLIATLQTSSHVGAVCISSRGYLEVSGKAQADDERSFGEILTETANTPRGLLGDLLAPLVARSLDLRLWNGIAKETADQAALMQAIEGSTYLDAVRQRFDAADYFRRSSRAIAEAALEEIGDAGLLDANDLPGDGAKKAELATHVAALATREGWLPPELRHRDYVLEKPEPARVAIEVAVGAGRKAKVRT